MKQNKGYSLIEIIVVIAIMMTLIGAGILQMSMVSGYRAKQCAKNIEAQLNKVQITNMSKKLTEMVIYQDASDGAYYVKVTENKGIIASEKSTNKQVGKGSLLITYSMDAHDSDIRTLEPGKEILIQFNRATGALVLERKDDTDPSKTKKIGCHRIWMKQKGGNTKVYTITIHQETGKIEVEAGEVKYTPAP